MVTTGTGSSRHALVLAAALFFVRVGFMTWIDVHLGHGSAAGIRTLFDAITRAHTLKPISVAVFAGAAAWPPGASTCHGDHLIELEMQRPEAALDQVLVRLLGLKRQVNQIGNRPTAHPR